MENGILNEWELMTSDQLGDHCFSGRLGADADIEAIVPRYIIATLHADCRKRGKDEGGIAGIQQYRHKATGIRIILMDEFTQAELQSGKLSKAMVSVFNKTHVYLMGWPWLNGWEKHLGK